MSSIAKACAELRASAEKLRHDLSRDEWLESALARIADPDVTDTAGQGGLFDSYVGRAADRRAVKA